ncbi:MAG: hypothetical protein ACR2LK_14955 [Solirubrobacteraceae bacterium]
MAVEAELLRSEGIDPRWPGFPEPEKERDEEQSGRSPPRRNAV